MKMTRMRRLATEFAPLMTLLITSSEPGEAGPSDVKPKYEIGRLAWIAGDWRTTIGGDSLHERWVGPEGGAMMGMFRWIKNGRVWLFEFLTITEEDGGVIFRFRHFGPDLSCWEEKNDPLTFRLKTLGENEAVFENPARPANRPKRIIYRREGDVLTVRIEGDDPQKADEFRFTRSGD